MFIQTDYSKIPNFIHEANAIKDKIENELAGINIQDILQSNTPGSDTDKTLTKCFRKKRQLLSSIEKQIDTIKDMSLDIIKSSKAINKLTNLHKDVSSIWQRGSTTFFIDRKLQKRTTRMRRSLQAANGKFTNMRIKKHAVSKIYSAYNTINHLVNKSEAPTFSEVEEAYLNQKFSQIQRNTVGILKAAEYVQALKASTRINQRLLNVRKLDILANNASTHKQIKFYEDLESLILFQNTTRDSIISTSAKLESRIKLLKSISNPTDSIKNELADLQILAATITETWENFRKPTDPLSPSLVYKDAGFVKFASEAKKAFDAGEKVVTVLKRLASLAGKAIPKEELPSYVIEFNNAQNPDDVPTDYKSPQAIAFSMASDGLNIFTSSAGVYFSAVQTYAKLQKYSNYAKQVEELEQNYASQDGSIVTIQNRPLYVKLKNKMKKMRPDIGIGAVTLGFNTLDLGNSILNLVNGTKGFDIAQNISELTKASELLNPITDFISEITGPLGKMVGVMGIGIGAYHTIKGIDGIIKSEDSIIRAEKQITKHEERRKSILRLLKVTELSTPEGIRTQNKLMRELHFSDLELRRARHKVNILRKKKALDVLKTTKTGFFTVAGAMLFILGLATTGLAIPIAIASLALGVLSLISFFVLRAYENEVNKSITTDITNRATKKELSDALKEVNSLDDNKRSKELAKIYEMLDESKIQSILEKIHKSHQNQIDKDNRTDFPKNDSDKIIDLFKEYSNDALDMYYWSIIN